MVTKAVMGDSIQEHVGKMAEIGQNQFKQFVSERISNDAKNIWAPMKKLKLQMWSAAGKKIKVSAGQ